MTTKVHASQGELSECPHREHKYRLGEWRQQAKTYFIRGRACHAAREFAFLMFMEHGEIPPLPNVITKAFGDTEAAESEIDERSPWRRQATDEEVTKGLDEAGPIIEADYTLGMPKVAPYIVAVEEEVEIPLEGFDAVLTGRFDARAKDPVTGGALVPDLKTAAKAPGQPAQRNADLSNQLSLYAALHQAKWGSIPTHSLEYVWTMKRGPKKETAERDGIEVTQLEDGAFGCRRVLTTQRSQSDISGALALVRVRLDAEKHGWYPPASSQGIVSPCQNCDHRAHPDPSQRCEFRPNILRSGTDD